jgi:hypothetical protein
MSRVAPDQRGAVGQVALACIVISTLTCVRVTVTETALLGRYRRPENGTVNMSRWAAVILAAPGCFLAAVSAGVLILAAFDLHPLWPHRPINLAEAAGVRDEAEVVRLIQQGHDPNVRYVVRTGSIVDFPLRLTPLEAAVAADDAPMVDRLLANGAQMDSALWTYLRCIAGGDEVPSTLDRYRPVGALLRCEGVTPPWPSDGDR